MCVEYMVWFEHRVYFCTNTKSVADSQDPPRAHQKLGRRTENEIVAANTALGTGILISTLARNRANDERYTARAELMRIRAAAASDERYS